MPKWLKLVLLLLGVGVLGLGLFVGGIVWWVSANKDRIVDRTRAAQQEGARFGATHPKGECIEDSLTRIKSCGEMDFPCEVATKIRLSSCMAVAAEDGACERFSASRNLLKEAFAGNEECKRRGQGGSAACGRLLQGVGEECRKTRP